MSRPLDRSALRRDERRLGELRTLGARAQGAAMRRAAPLGAAALAAFAPLAALALLVAAAPLDAAWHDAAATQLVIVPDPTLPAADGSAGTRMEAASRILGTAAAPEGAAALRQLLTPWLGADIDAATLPGLLAMKRAPDPALAARLQAAAPAVTIAGAPADAAAGLARLDLALRIATTLALALALVLSAACLHLGARRAIGPARPSIRVMARLGERPAVLARRAARLAAGPAACGGALGTALAAPLLLLAAGGRPGPAAIACVLAAAPLCTGLAALATGLRAHRTARARPA